MKLCAMGGPSRVFRLAGAGAPVNVSGSTINTSQPRRLSTLEGSQRRVLVACFGGYVPDRVACRWRQVCPLGLSLRSTHKT
eukprot:545471-Pyramimonas_sp.AAC.1